MVDIDRGRVLMQDDIPYLPQAALLIDELTDLVQVTEPSPTMSC